MFPILGWSNHKMPIDNLYLCGSGVHGGGQSQRGSRKKCGKNVVKGNMTFLFLFVQAKRNAVPEVLVDRIR
jgi:hypothetical protein